MKIVTEVVSFIRAKRLNQRQFHELSEKRVGRWCNLIADLDDAIHAFVSLNNRPNFKFSEPLFSAQIPNPSFLCIWWLESKTPTKTASPFSFLVKSIWSETEIVKTSSTTRTFLFSSDGASELSTHQLLWDAFYNGKNNYRSDSKTFFTRGEDDPEILQLSFKWSWLICSATNLLQASSTKHHWLTLVASDVTSEKFPNLTKQTERLISLIGNTHLFE